MTIDCTLCDIMKVEDPFLEYVSLGALSANDPQLTAARQEFASYFLSMGDGKETTVRETSLIQLKDEMFLTGSDISTLATVVYNKFQNPIDFEAGSLISKAILAPKNTQSQMKHKQQYPFKRRQLPVRSAFAMTINKAQSQTLDSLGLFFVSSVFSYGQLYVAFSRIKQSSSIKIVLDRNTSTTMLKKVRKRQVEIERFSYTKFFSIAGCYIKHTQKYIENGALCIEMVFQIEVYKSYFFVQLLYRLNCCFWGEGKEVHLQAMSDLLRATFLKREGEFLSLKRNNT
ncbi:MAG: hypothetical protein EXX96DRAFT_540892 [Benjaminiella poitrasii]|nr:MAG: hypothetical protein EXX96DRAFT_540892 [Benjaminiella poitrasii]